MLTFARGEKGLFVKREVQVEVFDGVRDAFWGAVGGGSQGCMSA